MTRATRVSSLPLARAQLPLAARLRLRKRMASLAIHLPLLLCAVTMLFPLVWLLSTSLKHPGKQFAFPPQLWPNPFYPKNYSELFRLAPMGMYLFNSTKIAVLSTIGTGLSSAIAAFAFARMRFRGRDALFAVLLATMMIPGQVTIIPTFVIIRTLGWIDNHASLIVPSFFASAFNVFLLRQFYMTIPQDLMDSAMIDGASFVRIFWQIFVPLGMPALTTVAVFNFLGAWNDLFGPLIFLNSQTKMTLALGLSMLRGRAGSGGGHWGVIMAGATLGVVPMLILYFFGQKYFVQGLARTGLKG